MRITANEKRIAERHRAGELVHETGSRVELVKQAMKRARIDQKELARRLGLPPSSVSRWMCGARSVPAKYVPAIAALAEGGEQ